MTSNASPASTSNRTTVVAPATTYRLQIRPQLTLQDAADLVDYLVELGVGAVYLSPILTATSGSDHGYDTTDPRTIDPARGGEEGWRALVEGCRAAGLGVVVDIVPNHLGISKPVENPAWWSVLAEGESSPYARWFDIDWGRAPVLVPILGDDGVDAITIEPAGDGYEAHYHEHRFPIAAGTYAEGDPVAEVLGRQHYRLAPWREAATGLNYRRFFAVTTLAGVRVEDPEVFEATHERVLRWLADGEITGLRIDHPDGLVDPGGYFQRLREHAPGIWIIAEKILEAEERLPEQWPIEGTSGYDAMTEVNQVFVDPAHAEEFTATYRELADDDLSLHDHILIGKTSAATELLPAELGRLVALAPELDPARCRRALVGIAARLPVYRSYVPLGTDLIAAAADETVSADPELADTVAALVPRLGDPSLELALRFQQFSGAVMAKGVEDTAYYRYNRFVALNEVGGAPERFGLEVAEFHAAMAERQERAPLSMTALATHDTKRSEDVRARLAVMSEIPGLVRDYLEEFLKVTKIPDRSLGCLLAQTFVGAGLIERERMHAYAEKAMREAARGTTWTDPDSDFESAVHAAVDAAYDDDCLNDALERLLTQIEQPGWSNSLGQKLVQLTMPGVPDTYQGTELWDDSLVDPDNRRPVDFAARRELLGRTDPPWVDRTGAAKLWVVRHALRLRRDHPELFGSYAPVLAQGDADHHLLGFDRGGAITLVTRQPYTLATRHDGWGHTTVTLPEGEWRDVLTDRRHSGTVELPGVFHHYPVALLIRA